MKCIQVHRGKCGGAKSLSACTTDFKPKALQSKALQDPVDLMSTLSPA